MGFIPLLSSALVLSQIATPAPTAPKVISVSMFKNGYAFITREIPMTDGQARIVDVPKTSLGSLWFWTNEGQIESVTSVDETTPTSTKIPFNSFQDVLAANIGKKFGFNLLTTEEKDGKKTDHRSTVEGILKSYSPELLAVEGADGTVMVPFSHIEGVTAKDAGIVLNRENKGEAHALTYQVRAKGNTKSVMMMSLERGMAWAPGYAIDLSAPDKLTFTAKSTVLNDLLDFQDAKVRLITGFPNLQFQNILDPLTSGMSVDDWLRSISAGAPANYARDSGMAFQNTRAGEITRKAAAGGFGGGGIGGPAGMSGADFVAIDNVPGEQLEDLFYYDLEKVSLKKGSRSYQYIYQFDAPYKRTFTWDGESGTPVFNKIKFKNQTGKPISTAAASMFKKGEIVGQGMMNYTAANTEAELTVSRSLDIKTSSTTEIADRAVGAIKDKKGNPTMDLITYETELEVENPKDEAINFSIRKVIAGDVQKSEPKAEMDTSKTGLKGTNPYTILKWDTKIEAGQSVKYTVRYRAYVPTGQ